MTSPSLPWNQPDWLDQARTWITTQLAKRDLHLVGPIEQKHARPWSTVVTAPTQRGMLYFKACAPVLRHEPALTQALYAWRPDCMLTVLDADLERGWLLMPDESPMLRTLVKTTADLTHWEKILPVFAGLQQEMAGRAENLLAMGVPDRRLPGLPAQFAALLEDRAALLIDQEDGLTGDQYERLLSLLPRYEQMCAELAAYGLPETLHHDDFHDANVFVPGGRYAFSDWGESCLAQPFFTMLVTLRSIAYRLDLAYGGAEHNFVFAPELLHLRDIYLEQWTGYASPAALLRAFDLAWTLAMVNRAITWHRVLSAVPEQEREAAYAVPAWLQEFLDRMRA